MLFVVFIMSFMLMEGVAWLSHKFLMHGVLWGLHADHHKTTKPDASKGFLEMNDWFFVLFSLPAMFLFVAGTFYDNVFFLPIGLGIAAYGACYFLVHDIFIHQRLHFFRNTENRYLLAIRRAHKVHHKHLGKYDGECFGMLVVPLKYFRDASRV